LFVVVKPLDSYLFHRQPDPHNLHKVRDLERSLAVKVNYFFLYLINLSRLSRPVAACKDSCAVADRERSPRE
jgi:hypothetical protein